MTKSWGARIFGRLFNLGSKKADAEKDEISTLEIPVKAGPQQLDQDADDLLPNKSSEYGLNQLGPEATAEAEPTKDGAKAQMNVGKPQTLEILTSPVKQMGVPTDKPATLLATSGPTQKPSRVRVPKSQRGFLADKGAATGETLAAGKTPNKQSIVGNGKRKRKSQDRVQNKITGGLPVKRLSKADSKTSITNRLENCAEELVSVKQVSVPLEPSWQSDLLKVDQGRSNESTIRTASTSTLKRSRKQRSKALDEQVTDELLAELEADNTRLKLLLLKKLNSEFSK